MKPIFNVSQVYRGTITNITQITESTNQVNIGSQFKLWSSLADLIPVLVRDGRYCFHSFFISSSHIRSFNCSRPETDEGKSSNLEQCFMLSFLKLQSSPKSSGKFRMLMQPYISRKVNLERFLIESGNEDKLIHDLSLNSSRFTNFSISSGSAVIFVQCVMLSFFMWMILQRLAGNSTKSSQKSTFISLRFGSKFEMGIEQLLKALPMLHINKDNFCRLLNGTRVLLMERIEMRSNLILFKWFKEPSNWKFLNSAWKKL